MVAHAAHARALIESDADLLDEVSRTFERLGVWIDAAEAAAGAASLYAHSGRTALATRTTHRSSALSARCPAARTPALLLTVASRPLTVREREVAGLAARGWTTARIADALVLSVRTVDNHLQHTYDKLGICSRRELTHLLHPVVTGPTSSGSTGGR